ncbi:hypothetical protein RHSIM_Rhsim09G0200100 [Rhododendron simsii]|uniref:Uncharacterized protein n=1 Tax=Rhododendron simsii TaxID=118357 RepID=A0A834GIB2_RHOSS|nr:hypothetical protein RHSIM_Rhsim09G0200100 [Rhododendron simsii]
MATQARGLIRDQNLSVHFDVAPLGAKTNVLKSQKNGGGLGGRKALNDISNSGRPSALHSSKTHNSKNVISSGEEIGSSKMKSSFGGKRNASKAPEKVQAGGRKALSDLTNSGKPYVQQSSKDSCCNKLGAVMEEQFLSHNVTEEQVLHNHQECIKAQQKGIDMDYFLQSIGLETDNSIRSASPQVSPLSSKLKAESPPKYLEIKEMSELLYLDRYQQKNTRLPSVQASPCGSPKSPKPCVMWEDYNLHSLTLMKSPKLSNIHNPI